MNQLLEKFTPVTKAPEGFVRVTDEQSSKLIRANHPKHKRWHLLRFDLNGFDHCNVFVEETGELILITVPEGQFANPILFPKSESAEALTTTEEQWEEWNQPSGSGGGA